MVLEVRFCTLDDGRDDRGVSEGRDVAELVGLALGDFSEDPAHDLARASLGQPGDELEEIGRLARFHYCGIYPIRKAHRRCHRQDRIYFQFRNDGESAIIHSESGIDDLCYNSGAKGHLIGNWYWMKED